MLIFFHGTGDDDSKSENFIPAIAKLLRERYGEIVLVMPGVSSAQRNQIGTRATECLELIKARSLHEQWQPLDHNHSVSSNPDGLNRAIQQAKSSVLQYSTTPVHEVPDYVSPGAEAAEIQRLIQSQRGEGYSLFGMVKRSDNKQSKGIKSVGIKSRMSIAALCAVRYKRLGGVRPLRIIGHSRGGSAAIGAHNLIAYHGFEADKTLTLDPCHGLMNPGAGVKSASQWGIQKGAATVNAAANAPVRMANYLLGSKSANVGQGTEGALSLSDVHLSKDYYSKVWNGNLINIPCEKGVAHDTIGRYVVMRPVIEQAGTANCFNLPKLKTIRHGHMGKFKEFPKKELKKQGYRVGGMQGYGANVSLKSGVLTSFYGFDATEKRAWQGRIQRSIDGYIANLGEGVPLDEALRGLFNAVDPLILSRESDIKTIVESVIDTICCGETVGAVPYRNSSLYASTGPSSFSGALFQDEGDVDDGFSDDEDDKPSGSSSSFFRLT